MMKRFHTKDDEAKPFRRMGSKEFDTKMYDVKLFQRVRRLNYWIHLEGTSNGL